MEVPVQLKNDIIAYLTSLPGMVFNTTQQALLMGANLDPQLLTQINFGLPPAPFFQILLTTCTSYGRLHDGRDPIEAILQASRESGGADQQTKCDQLIQKWKAVRTGTSPAISSDSPQNSLQPSGNTSFSWLHLTDIHCGMKRQSWLWPGVRHIVFEDLERLHEKSGPWDLVLFTGDLTQKGSADEFQKANDILVELWKHLETLGSTPQLLAVPGNHDLVRPEADTPSVVLLKEWLERSDIQQSFWDKTTSPYRKIVTKAFKNYATWWDTQSLRVRDVNSGILPGDFSATIEKNGARLGIVGLNSSFLQLTGDNYEGKLALHTEQFHQACGGDGVQWAEQHHACLFMTHHPPAWLSPDARQHLHGEITDHSRFAVHLCGHMHANVYRSISESGTDPQRLWQGRSLFGLEYYDTENKLERSHGYSVGTIALNGEEGALTFWPREDRKQGYQRTIVPDYSINLEDEQHTAPTNVKLLQAYP